MVEEVLGPVGHNIRRMGARPIGVCPKDLSVEKCSATSSDKMSLNSDLRTGVQTTVLAREQIELTFGFLGHSAARIYWDHRWFQNAFIEGLKAIEVVVISFRSRFPGEIDVAHLGSTPGCSAHTNHYCRHPHAAPGLPFTNFQNPFKPKFPRISNQNREIQKQWPVLSHVQCCDSMSWSSMKQAGRPVRVVALRALEVIGAVIGQWRLHLWFPVLPTWRASKLLLMVVLQHWNFYVVLRLNQIPF